MVYWLFEYAVTYTGFLLAVLLTTALAGKIVNIGKGYGTVYGSHRFQRFNKLFLLFLFEAIGLSVFFTWLEPIFDKILWEQLIWLPTIITESLVIFYYWFCREFKFAPQREHILYPQFVLVVNLLLVLLIEPSRLSLN